MLDIKARESHSSRDCFFFSFKSGLLFETANFWLIKIYLSAGLVPVIFLKSAFFLVFRKLIVMFSMAQVLDFLFCSRTFGLYCDFYNIL